MSFLNTISSSASGRTYLLNCPELIKDLVKILHFEKQDSNLRQNALGTLQKISLRRLPQSIMIQLQLVSWILNLLNSHLQAVSPDQQSQQEQQPNPQIQHLFPIIALSQYSLEYSTALLLNLCLRQNGKKKCSLQSHLALKVTFALLKHPNIQVRTFINGVIYSLLDNGAIRRLAIQLSLKEKLLNILNECGQENELQKQLQYIIQKLQDDQQNQAVNDNSEEQEEYEDDEYQDDDEDDDEEEEEEEQEEQDQEDEELDEEDNEEGEEMDEEDQVGDQGLIEQDQQSNECEDCNEEEQILKQQSSSKIGSYHIKKKKRYLKGEALLAHQFGLQLNYVNPSIMYGQMKVSNFRQKSSQNKVTEISKSKCLSASLRKSADIQKKLVKERPLNRPISPFNSSHSIPPKNQYYNQSGSVGFKYGIGNGQLFSERKIGQMERVSSKQLKKQQLINKRGDDNDTVEQQLKYDISPREKAQQQLPYHQQQQKYSNQQHSFPILTNNEEIQKYRHLHQQQLQGQQQQHLFEQEYHQQFYKQQQHEKKSPTKKLGLLPNKSSFVDYQDSQSQEELQMWQKKEQIINDQLSQQELANKNCKHNLDMRDQSNIYKEPPSFSKNYNSLFQAGAKDASQNNINLKNSMAFQEQLKNSKQLNSEFQKYAGMQEGNLPQFVQRQVGTPVPQKVKQVMDGGRSIYLQPLVGGQQHSDNKFSRDILTPNTVQKIQAFASRDKLLRTPPQQSKDKYIKWVMKEEEEKKSCVKKAQKLPESIQQEPQQMEKKSPTLIRVQKGKIQDDVAKRSAEKQKTSSILSSYSQLKGGRISGGGGVGKGNGSKEKVSNIRRLNQSRESQQISQRSFSRIGPTNVKPASSSSRI